MNALMRNLVIGMASLLALAASNSANALLMFEVQRVDDSNAQIQGSGSIDIDGLFNSIVLVGATSTGDTGLDSFGGTFTIGGVAPESVFTEAGTEDFAINFFDFPRGFGDSPAGLMTALLDVETWNPAGTIGNIVGGPSNVALGTYEIVNPSSSVPEPTTLALMGLGLAGLGFSRRKKA